MFCSSILGITSWLTAQESTGQTLRSALCFHAPFDGDMDARLATGDRRIFTAESVARKQTRPGNERASVMIARGAGKYGDAIRFADKGPEVLFYAGESMHYRSQNWSGSVSFWMKLDPNKDLKPGYCDPLQITQLGWNNGAFFVDFDKDLPRDFRLGVFSDLKFWNPENIAWEKLPIAKRPMVTVKTPPFSRDTWTHVAFTFDNVNATDVSPAVATLYINGESQGSLRNPMQFHWDLAKTAIMIGIDYIGDLDDLAIFRRALSADEIRSLYALPEGVAGLR